MKTILVTGGSGLVGSAIKTISKNHSDKYNFLYLDSKTCNLLSYEDTLNYFTANKPDYVIHLAANVGGLFKNMEQPVALLEDNLVINTNVLKASHAVQVQKLVACLSTCIFPDNIAYPISEDDLHLGPPHFSNAPYAYAKRILQIHCKAYKDQYNDNFMCVVPTNIYGPYDNFHLADAHVIPALIHKCYLAKQNNEKFVISGSGTPLRQFIYSEDLANLMLWTLENYDESDSIILSPNEEDEVTIEFVARTIAREFDYEDQIEFDRSKADGQYKKTVSNDRYKKQNTDYSFVKIEDGIKATVAWFQEHYPNVRK